MAADESMIHRLTTIPWSPVILQQSVIYYKKIAFKNGYNLEIIDKLVEKNNFNFALG